MLLVSGGGSGLGPWAPGTWGSAAAAGLWIAVVWLATGRGLSWWGTWWTVTAVTVALAVVASIVCIWLGDWSARKSGRGDPGFVVVDEWAGQWVALLLWPGDWINPEYRAALVAVVAAQFLMFRLFDITKPYPCRALEKLPAGWGILADDLMAGLYANVAGQCLLILAPALLATQHTH